MKLQKGRKKKTEAMGAEVTEPMCNRQGPAYVDELILLMAQHHLCRGTRLTSEQPPLGGGLDMTYFLSL